MIIKKYREDTKFADSYQNKNVQNGGYDEKTFLMFDIYQWD